LTLPVVAIGGINQDNIAEVVATNVGGIAMISAITQACDPIAATNALLASMAM
jgi:thiamine-phosphate pyrophosphorylase